MTTGVQPIRVGIIGTGFARSTQVPAFRACPGVEVVSIASARLERAEEVAREHGCVGIWLDTFTFQAPGFYQKLGYTVFGEISNYPPGSSRFFLHKHLS